MIEVPRWKFAIACPSSFTRELILSSSLSLSIVLNTQSHKSNPQSTVMLVQVDRQHGNRSEENRSAIIANTLSFRALYYWAKIMGLNPLLLTKKNRLEFSYLGLFYGLFLLNVHCCIFYSAMIHRVTLLLPGETPIAIIVDFIGIAWQFLEIFSTLVIFAICQKRVKKIVEIFLRAEETSKKLGIFDDHQKYAKIFAAYATVANITNLLLIVHSEIMWTYVHPFEMIVWWCFNFATLVALNMGLLFVSGLLIVNHTFRRLNEEVGKMVMADKWSKRHEPSSEMATGTGQPGSDNILEKIDVISRLHRELRSAIRKIEEHFMVPIFFTIARSFTYITLDIYLAYRFTKQNSTIVKEDLVFLGAASNAVINGLASLIIISNVCGSTRYEANNTGNAVHAMLSKSKNIVDTPEVAKLNLLLLDLLRNRVRISVLGLFELDHFLIYGTLATAATHLTIMLQLYS